jgi:hypothetical protein
MPDNDDPPDNDDLANNVIPFPSVIPHAVAQGLRDYYASLLCEPMPDEIAALCREIEKRAQKAEGSEEEPDAGVA